MHPILSLSLSLSRSIATPYDTYLDDLWLALL